MRVHLDFRKAILNCSSTCILCIYIYGYRYVCVRVCTYVSIYSCTHICIHTYICIYIYVYIYIYIYICTHAEHETANDPVLGPLFWALTVPPQLGSYCNDGWMKDYGKRSARLYGEVRRISMQEKIEFSYRDSW